MSPLSTYVCRSWCLRRRRSGRSRTVVRRTCRPGSLYHILCIEDRTLHTATSTVYKPRRLFACYHALTHPSYVRKTKTYVIRNLQFVYHANAPSTIYHIHNELTPLFKLFLSNIATTYTSLTKLQATISWLLFMAQGVYCFYR